MKKLHLTLFILFVLFNSIFVSLMFEDTLKGLLFILLESSIMLGLVVFYKILITP